MSDMSHFVSVRDHQSSSVRVQLHSVDAERRQTNRSKLAAIINAVLFLGRQNIAFRGHREPNTTGKSVHVGKDFLRFAWKVALYCDLDTFPHLGLLLLTFIYLFFLQT